MMMFACFQNRQNGRNRRITHKKTFKIDIAVNLYGLLYSSSFARDTLLFKFAA